MAISEPTFSIGIEEEYLLVDKESRALAAEPPAALLSKAEERLRGQVSPEFLKSQIEVGTHVCRSVQEARDQLIELRSTIAGIADEFGLAPIASSTHPFAHWESQHHTDKERYNAIAKEIQHVGRRLIICGMHVHVGIEDDDLRIDLLGQAAYFLPHLLALSTSSPFWQGVSTGLKSYRLSVLDELPRTGLPHTFSSYSEFERTVELLVGAGLIEDATKLWWDMRPSGRFPTLEMRITDVCPLIEDSVAIASLYLCILRLLYRLRRNNQRWRHYPPLLIRENRWRAQRYGIEQGMVDLGKGVIVPFATLMEELFELVAEDAAHFGCTKELGHIRTILDRGTSADRQLARYEAVKTLGGSEHAALVAVVDELVEETMTFPGAQSPTARAQAAT